MPCCRDVRSLLQDLLIQSLGIQRSTRHLSRQACIHTRSRHRWAEFISRQIRISRLNKQVLVLFVKAKLTGNVATHHLQRCHLWRLSNLRTDNAEGLLELTGGRQGDGKADRSFGV